MAQLERSSRALLAASLAVACARHEPPGGGSGAEAAAASTTPVTAAGELEVEYAGCARVVAPRRCEIDAPATLWLWLPQPFRELHVTLDSRPLSVSDSVALGGYRAALPVEPGALDLRERSSGRSFRLELAPRPPRSLLDAAEAAKSDGQFERAIELAERAAQSELPVSLWLADGIRARSYLRLGRADEAAQLLERTTPALFEQGYLSDATRDVFARFYVLLQREFKIGQADEWLERWRGSVVRYPLGRALLAEHEGMLAQSSGDAPRALQHFGDAERRYDRLGQALDVARVRERQIFLLAEVGQAREAAVRHGALLATAAAETVCERAHMLTLHGWLEMLAALEGDPERTDSVAGALAAGERAERDCRDPELSATGLINRGLWALHTGDLAAARRVRSELMRLPRRKGSYLRAWISELEGRLALAEKRYEPARRAFASEALVGESAGDLDAELRARLGLAEVAARLDSAGAAERELRSAMAKLDRARREAPFGALTHTRFATRQRAAERLVELLLAREEIGEAYRVALASYRSALALRARSRELERLTPAERELERRLLEEYHTRRAALDAAAADDWRLTQAELEVARSQRQDELRALEQLLERLSRLSPQAPSASDEGAGRSGAQLGDAGGTYRLLLFPLGRDWVVFGDGAGAPAAQRVAAPLPESEELPTHPWLQPFAEALARAPNIELSPGGASWEWPFERWKLAGVPLGARRLSFSAGLPKPALQGRSARPLTAAVAADPTNDLPFARRELELARQALRIPVDRALAGDQVTASSLLRLMQSADFFHFAGHARRASSSEPPALLLGAGSRLELWELEALGAAPRWAVLSACESAASGGHEAGGGWGVAQVLLAAGAEQVVASVGPIADAESYEFQRAFYAGLEQGSDFADAFWHAMSQRDVGMLAAPALRLFVR